MAAVTLDIIQTGSASATLHVEAGDTVTLELANTVQNPQLAQAVAALNSALAGETDITFAANTAGGAS